MISILIPSYNDRCFSLVKTLAVQASAAKNLKFEILVADDGSTNEDIIADNRNINGIENCRFIEHGTNVGRSAIRNFLGHEARYDNLLFLDCEIEIPQNFIEKYISHINDAEVLCGGICAGGNADELSHNLRYLYEKESESSFTAEKRNKKKYHSFRTTNFLIKKGSFEQVLFDETIITYGYEDVTFGKALMDKNISISHIDNAVAMYRYEDNARFIEKTEESLRTLKSLSTQLQEFSAILLFEKRLKEIHHLEIAKWIFRMINKKLRTNITSSNPKLFCYTLYKLGYYITL